MAYFYDKIPNDKKLHLLAGFSISLAFGGFDFIWHTFGYFAGYAKEYIDKRSGKGTYDKADAAYTYVGAFVGFVVLILQEAYRSYF